MPNLNPCRVLLLALLVVPPPSGPAVARAQSGGTTFVVTSTADAGAGSLRQAILDANASRGRDTIAFDLRGAPPFRVVVRTALPAITDPVVLDGTTQPGYSGVPLVELRGDTADESSGLVLETADATVRALAIGGFAYGIRLHAPGGHVVEGCHIGTDASGTTAVPNTTAGILVSGARNSRIGGTTARSRNVISGNGSGRERHAGIHFDSGDNEVLGNVIGTDATGTVPLPNNGAGISAGSAWPLRIGGAEPGAGNTIAFNLATGVTARSGYEVSILGNAIFENGEQRQYSTGRYAIHRQFSGLVPWPDVTFVGPEGDGTRVRGAVRLTQFPAAPARIELFVNRAGCGGPGRGQGREFAGAVEVGPDAEGIYVFSARIPFALRPGDTVTATATSNGTTSEFGDCQGDTGGCERPYVWTELMRPYMRSVPHAGRATLRAQASGTGPLRFQWYRGSDTSEPIPGATSPAFETPPLERGSLYSFTVVASNGCGSAAATQVVAVCGDAPRITRHPESQTVRYNNRAALSVEVLDPSLTGKIFRWYEGERGDTSRPVGVSNVGEFSSPPLTDATRFWCRVADACGTADSDAARVTVHPEVRVSSARVKRSASGASQLVIRGEHLEDRMTVSLLFGHNQVGFEKTARLTAAGLVQKGRLRDGRTIDEAVPRGSTVFIILYGERGSAAFEYTRP